MEIGALLILARLSAAAYEVTDADIKSRIGPLGASLVQLFEDDNAAAFVCRWDGYQVVVIRGTQFEKHTDLGQIANNIEVVPLPIGGGFVHAGYYVPLRDLWHRIALMLSPSGPIIITGHSMGGVRAHLARSFLPPDHNVQVVSFGAPKGATASFWRHVYGDRPPARLVHQEDFAPGWPFESPFDHPGKMLWLIKGRAIEIDHRPGFNISFDDHAVDRYVAALESLQAAGTASVAA